MTIILICSTIYFTTSFAIKYAIYSKIYWDVTDMYSISLEFKDEIFISSLEINLLWMKSIMNQCWYLYLSIIAKVIKSKRWNVEILGKFKSYWSDLIIWMTELKTFRLEMLIPNSLYTIINLVPIYVL